MRAIRFEAFGDPSVLHVAEVPDPVADQACGADYRAAPIEATCRLGEAQEAYRKVAASAAGRVVLRPQE